MLVGSEVTTGWVGAPAVTATPPPPAPAPATAAGVIGAAATIGGALMGVPVWWNWGRPPGPLGMMIMGYWCGSELGPA